MEIIPERPAAGTTIIGPPHTLRFQELSRPGSYRGGNDRSGMLPEVQVPAITHSVLPAPETEGVQRPRLGEILVGLELLTRPQLEEAIGRQEKEGGLFGQTVLRLSLTSKMSLSRALAVQSELRRVSLGEVIPDVVLRKVPAELAARLDVLPLTLVDNGHALVVATGAARAEVVRSEIRALVGMPVLPCVASPAAIHRLVLDVYGIEDPSVCATAWSVQPVSRAPFDSWREAFDVPCVRNPTVRRTKTAWDDRFVRDTVGRPVRRVGNILVSSGALDAPALQCALDHQRLRGGRLTSVVVELDLISAADLADVLARDVGAPVVRVMEWPAESAALQLLPPEVCERLRLLPLAAGPDASGEEVLVVATADPTDAMALDEVRSVAGRTIRIAVARDDEIDDAIRLHCRKQRFDVLAATGPSSLDPFGSWDSAPPECASPTQRFEAPPSSGAIIDDDPIGSGLLSPLAEEEQPSRSASAAPLSFGPANLTVRRKLLSLPFCRLLLVTGGPSSGKAELLQALQQQCPDQLLVLPDLAPALEVLASDPPPPEDVRRSTLREIFRRTIENARATIEDGRYFMALEQHGTIDCLQAWTGDEASFWQEMGSSREQEYARYAAVIHLRPPSIRAGGTRQAVSAQRAVEQAWAGHPRPSIIDWSADFQRRLMTIAAQVGVPLLARDCQRTG